MKRLLLALVLTVLVSGVAASPADARAGVGELAASTSESRDDATAHFPAGTTEFYALFEYEDLANHNIGVSLMGFGLTDITSQVDRYDGSGEAAVMLTGSAMYLSLAESMVAQAESASSNAKKAADQETGRIDYLDGVRAALNSMGASLALLEASDAGAEQSRLVADVSELVDELDGLVGYARELDLEDAEQKSRASALKQPASDLEAAANALSQGAQGVEGVPFPSTGAQSSYTLQVTMSGSPSQSIEVFVLEEGAASPGEALGGNDGASPTATQSASDGVGSGSTSGQSRNTTAGDDSGSSTDGSAGDAGSDEGDAGKATTPGTSGTTSRTPATSATARAMPSSAAVALGAGAGDGSAESADGQQSEGDLQAPQVDLAAAPAGGEQSGGERGAAPTWTVPAVAQAPAGGVPDQADSAASDETGGSGGSSGPNLAVLGLGAIALVGVAVWLRQRS